MADFTKGKWEVIEGDEAFIITDSGGNTIATVPFRQLSGNDARLIAAAPDLLEELQLADEEICQLCKELNPWHKDCTSCEARESRLQALTKAEGKEVK